jgi:hypothetical protein
VVGALLLVLAGAARWWPDEPFARPGGTLLVLLPEPDLRREEALHGLAGHLGTAAGVDLHLAIARDLAGLREQAADALLVMGPDAAVLSLDPAAWYPLVSGRRRAPWNLRPVPVVVSRRSAAEAAQPWRTAPRRTVVGDSLSLVCRALLGPDGLAAAREAGVSWGRDPYDHRPVLWALEMGAFDHAVVRQWDAEAMVAAGHLDPEHWRVRAASDPVPDVLVVASRRLPTARRVPLQQALSLLGRSHDVADPDSRAVTAGLGLLGLDGFNLLATPDLDQVRRRHAGCWPAAGP